MDSNFKRRTFLAAAGVTTLCALLPELAAAADDWPSKPVRLMVPFPAGAGADAMARLIGRKLEEQLGKPIVVENKNGATGTICADYVAKSAPDGYTFMLAHVSANAIGPLLVAKGRFDPVNDFTPVGMIGITPHVLAVNPKTGINSVQELIAKAKAEPGKLTFMSAGIGSAPHIGGEAFKNQAQVDMLHVPFKGTGEAMIALLGGEVDMTFSSTGSAMQHIRSGKLRAIAVTSPKRLSQLPNVPTIGETLKGYELMTWYGIAGPAKLPPAIVSRMETALQAVLKQPDVIKKLEELDAEVRPGTSVQFGKFWADEVARYQKLIVDTKLKA